MLQEGSVPLRWGRMFSVFLPSIRILGVVEFVDTCLENDVVVSILTRTQSDRADDVWNGLKPLFGEDRAARVKEIAWPQSSKTSDEMEETLNEKIREEKRRIADVFISFMNERRRNKQYELEMDANLQRSRKPSELFTFCFRDFKGQMWMLLFSYRWPLLLVRAFVVVLLLVHSTPFSKTQPLRVSLQLPFLRVLHNV